MKTEAEISKRNRAKCGAARGKVPFDMEMFCSLFQKDMDEKKEGKCDEKK